MPKFYITFGQAHTHSVSGKTLNKDCLAEIEAETPEHAYNKAMMIFDGKFHNCHAEKELPAVIEYYPRGVIKI